MIEKPIIIIGTPRSGTTFLGDVLSAHPDLAYAIEPSPIWRHGNESSSDMLYPADARPEVVSHVHRRFGKLLESEGRRRLLEKTPQNCLRIPYINQVFPDAVFIHILRDPLESILSIRSMWNTNTCGFRGVRISQRLKEMSLGQIPRYSAQFLKRVCGKVTGKRMVMWGPLLPGMQGLVDELDILEVSSLQWRWCIENAVKDGRNLPSARYREYRLNELDEAKLQDICDFCGLRDEGSVMRRFRELYRPQSIKAHSNSITGREHTMISKWIEPTVTWLSDQGINFDQNDR